MYAKPKNRVEGLTDGAYAIIMTLLVLEVEAPASTAELQELLQTLEWFIVSFVLLGAFWIAHNNIMDRVVKVNRRIMWANIGFLIPSSLIPFTTAWAGSDGPMLMVARQVYGLNSTAVAVALLILWLTAAESGQLQEGTAHTRRLARALVLPTVALTVVGSAPIRGEDHVAGTIMLLAILALAGWALIRVGRLEKGGREK